MTTERPERIVPTSYAQRRLWFLDQLEPGSPAYNIARAIRVCGSLDYEVLRASLQELVARHESLRTTFADIEGDPMQVIAPRGSLELPVIDLDHLPAPERDSAARRLASAEALRPVDLACGPLTRTTLLRVGPTEHIMTIAMHHIITDAWSMSVLWEELWRVYEAFAAGLPSPLPSLPLQYADFARWQRESLTGDALDRHLAYWRNQLAGADAVLDLPIARARPAVRTAHGATQRRVFSRALRDRLGAVSRESNATLFMCLVAAFQTLLWRYTDRDDLVIGSVTAGRSEVELESLVGFFVNTVVMRTRLSGDPTFRELLARVQEMALEAYAHQDLPFETLIETLQLPRSLTHTPLFQIMFILQNAPRARFELPGLTLEELELDSETAKFDLTVEMAEIDEGLFCVFEYSADLFDQATMARMLGHFECLLEGIASDPGQRVSALPLLGAAERHQLVVEWNDTAAAYPHDQCIHQLFEAQAERTGDAMALVYRDQRLTYRELNARANQLAHYLRARGVGPGVLVGICIERSLEAVVGMLGVLKAGGAYVAMDPAYPEERLAFMLEDSRTPVLLTVKRLAGRVPPGAAQSLCLDADWDRLRPESVANPASGVNARDLAYVIYTSGSTGTPKGVLASHRAAVNRFSWMWKAWRFAPGEICCQKTALSFVDSVWEIFGPLLKGIPNVIIPEEELEDLSRMVDTLAANRVTRIVVVPSLLRFLLESVPDLRGRIPDLKFWVTSGEAITPELARRFREQLPDATLMNLYGSSEVSADVTWYVIGDGTAPDRIPIGRPIANTTIYILDRTLNPVPIGVPGEIHVAGDGLAHGYLNRPELTAQKFIPDPFAGDPEARLFKTGDVGRFLADGNVEFLGRVDNQVKIRGVRIELGEIESVLRAHPSVEAAVVTVSGAGGDERLIGYVVPSGGSGLEPGDLRGFVRAKLPSYMVPASLVVLGALPLMPNGKVDRRALPAPDLLGPALGRPHVAPRNAMEGKLAEMIAEVLKRERVGIHDNFFDLGGHSLLGTQVIARVRKAFAVELPLRALFEEPTVAGLCGRIAAADKVSPRTLAAATRSSSPLGREELLARLDQLTEEEVNALLSRVRARNEAGRKTEDV